MIKFKQKEYGLPLLGMLGSSGVGNAVMIGSTAIGMKQANDAEKQNEELAEQSRKDNAKTRAALDRLANSNASQETKEQAASLFSDLRMFAAPGGVLKNLGGLAKDMWKNSGSGVKNAAKLGAGFAVSGYIGNRLATSLKNQDEGREDKNKNFLAKAALGTGALVGGVMAARRGKLGGAAQNFMTTGYGGRALSTGKRVFMENVSPVKIKKNGKFGGINVMNTAFLAAPVVSYLAQRKSQGDMAEGTRDDQRQYAFFSPASIKGIFNSVKNTAGRAFNKKTAARTWSGGFNKLSNFIGMTGGKGGTNAVQGAAKSLEKIGKQSGNPYTQRLARWAQNNPNKANLADGVGTMAVGGAAMSLGGKVITKPMKAVDKEAYEMEEQENGKI